MTTTLGFPPEPPAAPEAEAALLGAAMLMDAELATIALSDMVASDFTVAAHLLVFEAMTSVLSNGMAPVSLAVLSELRRMGRVSSWPTPSASVGVFLAELVEVAPIPLGYVVARAAVLEAAARRRLHQACLLLGQAAGSGPFDDLPRLLSNEARAVLAAHLRLPLPELEAFQ